MSRGEIFIVSAPSGTGKNTLIGAVLASLDGLEHCISHTTRQARQGERDGDPYYFVDRETFQSMIAQGEFVEWAEYNGQLYGTSAREIDARLEQGIDVVLDIEVVGAAKLLEARPEAHAIFLLPPAFDTLRTRLLERNLDAAGDMAERLALSTWEIERYGLYHYVIINDDLDRASQALAAIILDKRHRVERQQEGVAEILADFRRRSNPGESSLLPGAPSTDT